MAEQLKYQDDIEAILAKRYDNGGGLLGHIR